MSAPAPLPPLAAPAVSAELRLAYVLHHLRRAYPAWPAISIGYAGQQLEVANTAGAFFQQQNPYPPAPNWREWRGRQIPVFFDAHPEKPLLELQPDGRAILHADLIAAAFYLLSGWQEYFSAARDRHGRFPYAASVQQRYHFVTVPVVNYYFDILKTAVEHSSGQPLRPRQWPAAVPFAACITHDIDNLFSAWKAPAKAALQRRDWRGFGQQLWQHVTRKDAWDNLAGVQQAVAAYGANSTFFVLPAHRPAPNGTPNADYRLARVRARLGRLAAAGAELGLHGSLGTSDSFAALHHEAKTVAAGPAGRGLRFHYLRWEPRTTPVIVATAGFAYDSTLGFAEHFGFRHSYCLPFQPFDFGRGAAFDFLEIPLNVMDATLHHPNYLRLAPAEIMPALRPMLREIEQFGGVCTVLWHNENFDPANDRNGPRQFGELMDYLRSRQAAFLTGQEICAALNDA